MSVFNLKKAPPVGAFFVFALAGLWLQPAQADSCAPPPGAHTVKVRYVHDGDTLVLADNRRIRLIGINTPELGSEDQPDQPLAVRARDQLRQLIFTHNGQVQLLTGVQSRDSYGRTLANLWLPDGSSLSAALLQAGLGWLVAIPPDTRFLDCYQRAEARARTANLGVWKNSTYAVRASTDLKLRDQGFLRVSGRIVRVNRAAGATWINLQGRFAIRIPDKDIDSFRPAPDRSWIGRKIEVSG